MYSAGHTPGGVSVPEDHDHLAQDGGYSRIAIPEKARMTADVAIAQLTVPAAVRAEREAYEVVRQHLDGYGRARRGLNLVGMGRARNGCELAIMTWISAAVAVAEAEDRDNPVRASARCQGRQVFKVAGPSNAACEQAWNVYQNARRSGDQAAIAAAHAEWRAAFVGGFEEMAARWAREDEEHVEDLRNRIDGSQRLNVSDAFPSPRTRAQELVQASRERTRLELIHRDAARYETGPLGWRPAGQ